MSLSFLLQVTDGSPSETGVENVPLWDIVADASQGFGLIIMLSLAAMFAYSIFIFVERFLALRKATKEEKGLLIKVKEYVTEGKVDAAKDYCRRSNSPSARMMEKGISRLGRPLDSISASIENTGKLEILRLEQRLSFLATAAGAAPMIGFLGTTIGMIMVFIDLQASSEVSIETIAPGTMTAMVTTVAGLIVGIVSYIGYNYLVARIGKVVYQMENDALEFMDMLHQPSK
ncbi:MAG: MotA/TolQ/ExbB proton channel family protein [Crocinitomicaceae bacterium]|nr:MotA/TolQ/ExbB proton channel family protein [Crocinitomicaceae bacterium]MDG2441546.1 MotA/TolQ/ExbB proton channel family protein [Crocinitomicaceae bacterium]